MITKQSFPTVPLSSASAKNLGRGWEEWEELAITLQASCISAEYVNLETYCISIGWLLLLYFAKLASDNLFLCICQAGWSLKDYFFLTHRLEKFVSHSDTSLKIKITLTDFHLTCKTSGPSPAYSTKYKPSSTYIKPDNHQTKLTFFFVCRL